MKMDMSQYLDVFIEESKEHLGSLNERLLELEKNPADSSALNEIFRAAHTLKGMSSTMGFEDLADLTHHMENVLSDLKEGLLDVNPQVVDVLFKCFDRLQLLVDHILDNIDNPNQKGMDNKDLITVLENIKSGKYESAAMAEKETKAGAEPVSLAAALVEEKCGFTFNDYDITILKEASDKEFLCHYIKVEVDKDCLMKAVRAFMVFKALEEDGEIVKSVPAAQELDEGKFDQFFELVYLSKLSQLMVVEKVNSVSEVKVKAIKEIDVNTICATKAPAAVPTLNRADQTSDQDVKKNQVHKVKQTVRVDIERLDKLMNLVGELVMHKGRLEQIGATQKVTDLNETIEQIDRISGDLQSVVMKVRMVPIEQVFNRFRVWSVIWPKN
jgi:two-component system chemotaxis sensor kinase CheA